MPIYTITKLERKTTSTGKQMIKADLTDTNGVVHTNVGIWADYPNFATLDVNTTTEGDIVAKGDFKNLYPARTNTLGRKSAGNNIKVAQERKEQMIEKAQERKNTSIAFFNATNSAIEMIKIDPFVSKDNIQERVVYWRDWFISEWEKYESSNDKGIPFP